MPTIPGLPQIRTINVTLTGRASALAQLIDTAGDPVALTNAVNIRAEFLQFADSALPLFTKQSSLGEISVLATVGWIFVPLPDVDRDKLRVGNVGTLRVTLESAVDASIILVNHFYFAALNQLISWAQPSEVVMELSTIFKNTQTLLGEIGGAGYLDGIPTLLQTVGCMLEMYINANNPPESWILSAGIDAAVAGAIVRPTDFNVVTNQKVWKRTQ